MPSTSFLSPHEVLPHLVSKRATILPNVAPSVYRYIQAAAFMTAKLEVSAQNSLGLVLLPYMVKNQVFLRSYSK